MLAARQIVLYILSCLSARASNDMHTYAHRRVKSNEASDVACKKRLQ